ncbi:hypothetical protein V6O07_05340, partial [Arthrospira platensis SPKY2]
KSQTYTSYAYHEKQVYNRDLICNELGLNCNLPIVIIASHVFNDVPHGYRHRIFVDYYEWLVETLNICSKIDYINWIVKEHPQVGDKKHNYNVDQTAKKLVMDDYKSVPNIKLAPDNMSNISLASFCHAIVTVSSTMSHELAYFGIPSILAGDSSVSSCGFTHNARNFEEYKSMLFSLTNLGKLTSEQIEKAYVAYAILFYFSRVESDFSLPGNIFDAINNMVNKKIIQGSKIELDPYFRNLVIQ